MNRDKFIHAVRRGLSELDATQVKEILFDLDEYITEAIRSGRTEESVTAGLGSPENLARELRAQANYERWDSERSLGNLVRVIRSVAKLGLSNLFLLFPFVFYLCLLTMGYMIFGALLVGGLAFSIAIFSNHFIGWPAISAISSSHQSNPNEAGGAQDNSKNSEDAHFSFNFDTSSRQANRIETTSLGRTASSSGIMLAGGAVGLYLCIIVTRLTRNKFVRHIKRQVDLLKIHKSEFIKNSS